MRKSGATALIKGNLVLVESVNIVKTVKCEKKLKDTIRRYEEQYQAKFDDVIVFNDNVLDEIRGTVIAQRIRRKIIRGLKGQVNVLQDSRYDELVGLNLRSIAEIANSQSPDGLITKERYRHHFDYLRKYLLSKISDRINHNSICISPMRVGPFMLKEQDAARMNVRVVYPQIKRIYTEEKRPIAVAIEKMRIDQLVNCKQLVILDGGIVSGITIVGLLESLNKKGALPQNILIGAVHANMYGILNIMRLAERLSVKIDIYAIITSYAISETLYAYYDCEPWKSGTLVTGDIGDYLATS